MTETNKTPQFSLMPWYPRDFASATRGWPLIARAVYRELLDAQWDIGGAQPGTLPADPQQLRELIGASAVEWKVGWRFVSRKFKKVRGGLQNPRLEQHRQSSFGKYQARVKGAEEANRLRAEKKAAAEAQRALSERSANAQRTLSVSQKAANAQRTLSVD